MRIPSFVALALATAALNALVAQAPAAFARIDGIVRDSASGRAPTKTRVCAFVDTGHVRPMPRCGAVDSVGFYRIDSVTPSLRVLSVQCAMVHAPASTQLAFEPIVVENSDIHRDWTVHASACDSRVTRRVTATFRGHHTAALETSSFVPCPGDAWLVPGDSLGANPVSGRAWVTWPAGGIKGVKWPDPPPGGFGSRPYYVQWHGTLIGPGTYGHIGMSPFEFRPDTLLVVRPAQDGDCR